MTKLDTQAQGWAMASLDRSLRTVFVWGLAAWQGVMVLAVVATTERQSAHWLLIGGSVAVVLLAVLLSGERLPTWVFVLAVDGLLLTGWLVADSMDGVLAFSTAWLGNFGFLLPVFALRGRQTKVFALVVLSVGPLGFAIAHSDVVGEMALATLVTGIAVIWAAGRSLHFLHAFAGRVDEEVHVSVENRGAAAVARAEALESAERSRVLHDTVINTLGAVASGGGATSDVSLVRQRCARDVETVKVLLEGEEFSTDLSDLHSSATDLGLTVHEHGLSAAELSRLAERLPADVQRALGAASRELITNVVKHSGTRDVDLIVTDGDGTLTITVADNGRGYDGEPVPGRGLAESVHARSGEVGVDVSVVTAPGKGCRTTLTYQLETAALTAELDNDDAIARTARFVRRLAAWRWATAVVVVGIAIEVASSDRRPVPASLMLGAMALCVAVAWFDVRKHGHMRPVATALVICGVPAVFLASLAAVDFARTDGFRWQAIAVTGPLVLLMEHTRTRRPLGIASAVLLATAAATVVVMVRDPSEASAMIAAGSAAALGVAGFWLWFQRLIGRLGRVAAAEHRAAVAARLDQATTEAAIRARQRWPRAGLRTSMDLLRGLADGSLDPAAADVRAACAEEESHLRKLTLLDPELAHLQFWLARSLNRARARGVRLSIRTSGVDVDDATAASFGQLLQDVVEATSEGDELTFSLFPVAGRLRLAIVGPTPVVSDVAERWQAPDGWDASAQTHDGIDMLEVLGALDNTTEESSRMHDLEALA